MNIEQIKDKINQTIEELLGEEFSKATTEQRELLGRSVIDPRALPSQMWYNEDTLVVPTAHIGMLNYYGGFEYIGKEDRAEFGDYTVFSGDSDRVQELLDKLYAANAPNR